MPIEEYARTYKGLDYAKETGLCINFIPGLHNIRHSCLSRQNRLCRNTGVDQSQSSFACAFTAHSAL